jgi:DNA-binding NtrC family response regulator
MVERAVWRPSILLVDEDIGRRDGVALELAVRGIKVESAEDVASAMETLAERPWAFSLVVTDLDVLPLGGHGLAHAVHGRWPDTPVAILVSQAPGDAGPRALSPGVTVIPRSPVPAQLARAIEKLVLPGRPDQPLAVLSESGWTFVPLRPHA